MTPEFNPMDPALEQAVSEIRHESPEPAVIEAAAARVWANLVVVVQASHGEHIRNCADFQALMPDYRAGRLSEARTLLLKDHLHQCVACRHVSEGKVVTMPAPRVAVRSSHTVRWVAAAAVLLAAATAVWIGIDQYGGYTGRAIVQAVNGKLYEVSPEGIRQLALNQELPMGVELRTAPDSNAVLELRDGSLVEMRERSSLYATLSASDITVHLGRGSVIVQAAHRSTGHLYVDTTDCRVAVTGTVFGVTSGVKGSRISVVQGEVHVTQDNREKVLHAGDQTTTSPTVEPESVRDDISWSRDREKLLKQLNELRGTLQQLQMPALRYSSKLLGRLPAGTALYVSLPNLSQYLAGAESVMDKKLAASPQLRAWWTGQGSRMGAVIEILRTGSEYLGEEIDVVSGPGARSPVMVAEPKRDGFAEFLQKEGVNLAIAARNGVLVFGPERAAVDAVASQLDSGFANTPLYARIAACYASGAGLLVVADLSQQQTPFPGARYFVLEQKQAGNQTVASAALGFDGPRTGIAASLAEPSPMGSLDYISPDATAVAAFVLKSPGAIVDAVLAVRQGSLAAAQKTLSDEHQQSGFDVRDDLSASLGGEFAFAVDGSLMPVPSWKLVSEIYDPNRFQATIQKLVDNHNRALKAGDKPLKTGQETVEKRVYYMIAQADSGPLLEAHYTFDQGYLIAGPTRALVAKALQMRTAGTSIKHSAKFLELTPRDHHVNFSALIYQNVGTTLAPFAALAGAFMPKGAGGRANPLDNFSNVKPDLYAVYAEPDRIAMSANGDVLGSSLVSLMNGNILGMTGIPFPGQMMGTRSQRTPYPVK